MLANIKALEEEARQLGENFVGLEQEIEVGEEDMQTVRSREGSSSDNYK